MTEEPKTTADLNIVMETTSVGYFGGHGGQYPSSCSEDRLYIIHNGVPYSVNGWRHKELMDRISALEKKMDAVLDALVGRKAGTNV